MKEKSPPYEVGFFVCSEQGAAITCELSVRWLPDSAGRTDGVSVCVNALIIVRLQTYNKPFLIKQYNYNTKAESRGYSITPDFVTSHKQRLNPAVKALKCVTAICHNFVTRWRKLG